MTDRGGFAALDPCVHCGFCLQACPTFLATGDEADSPRGRIELMRALEAGELAPDDPALALHLDRCLGCRGCEPVCPSGVGYGGGRVAGRVRPGAGAASDRNPSLARGLGARPVRDGDAGGDLAAGWWRSVEVGEGRWRVASSQPPPSSTNLHNLHRPAFPGCVMEGLFSHVHDATIRTLEV